MTTLACPRSDCNVTVSAAEGKLRDHLERDHGWSRVGAQEAEYTARRAAPAAPKTRPARGTGKQVHRTHSCKGCGRVDTRRDHCPDCNGPKP